MNKPKNEHSSTMVSALLPALTFLSDGLSPRSLSLPDIPFLPQSAFI